MQEGGTHGSCNKCCMPILLGMSGQRTEDSDSLRHVAPTADPGAVAGAEEILLATQRAITEIRAEGKRAAEVVRAAGEEVRREHDCAPEGARAEMEAERHDDRATMAEINRDLASVHSELGPIATSVIGLQSFGLRLTGAAALVLAVLIGIAWKVIGG